MLANDLKLVTKDIAAEVFSVSVKTIDNYIKDGMLPQPTRFVSKEYWHPDDFRDFLARTFRSLEAATDQVTEVTGGGSPSATVSSSAPAPTPAVRKSQAKDTNPVVRERARRKSLLARLNAD